jgi:ferrous iron transport protein B
MILAGDNSVLLFLKDKGLTEETINKITAIQKETQRYFTHPLSYVINHLRLKQVEEILGKVIQKEEIKKSTFFSFFEKASVHPIFGIPVLLFVLWIMYKFVGEFGAQVCVNFLENTIFASFINPWAVKIISFLFPLPFIQELFIGEYGIITMALTYSLAIVLPIVGTFFLFFGFIEDVGYLPRLSIMADKLFRIMGLNGKAVLPMVLGLGCDTMATMTARILDTKKERIIITLLLALGVPCSAQLGVILGMLAGLSAKAALIWAGVVIVVILLVGFLASMIIPGEKSPFILEIPPLRWPKLENILIKTLARMEWYLKEAVPLFILGTLMLFFADKIHLLKIIEKITSPIVVGFLGLPSKASEAFIIGFLRRDYGAAGLFVLAKNGQLDPIQIVVSLVTITLFVPCIAQFFMTVKERGVKTALYMIAFIFPFAFLIGGVLNFVLRTWRIL